MLKKIVKAVKSNKFSFIMSKYLCSYYVDKKPRKIRSYGAKNQIH